MSFRKLFGLLKPASSRTLSRKRSTYRCHFEALENRRLFASLTIGDATVTEGTSGISYASVVVSLSEQSSRPVSVNYATANLSASAGSDYDRVSGSLRFAKGETSKTILVPIRGDRLPEYDEQFAVRLSGAKGAPIADGVGNLAASLLAGLL